MHAINEEAVIDKLFGGARNRSVINEEEKPDETPEPDGEEEAGSDSEAISIYDMDTDQKMQLISDIIDSVEEEDRDSFVEKLQATCDDYLSQEDEEDDEKMLGEAIELFVERMSAIDVKQKLIPALKQAQKMGKVPAAVIYDIDNNDNIRIRLANAQDESVVMKYLKTQLKKFENDIDIENPKPGVILVKQKGEKEK